MRTLRRILGGLLLVVLLLAIAAGGFGVYTVRRAFPQTGGTLTVKGLQGPVDVLRDKNGIPHIYAASEHDLFMAQGFVHAQDRFYQMDYWRHQTAGRLAELYGEGVVSIDKFLRTLGWHQLAEAEYQSADPDTKALLEAYAAGVNAYLSTHSAADLSLEYSVLALNGLSGYQPEPWTPADTLAWGKAMAWDLGGNLDSEIQRAILMQTIGPEKTQEFLPVYPNDHPIIVPSPAVGAAALSTLKQQVRAVDSMLGTRFAGIGSNNWVIGGSRTTTGMPLLANDPHLSIQMPSIWYEMGLHCQPVSAACGFDVTGYSFAGVPAIVIGHNARVAWGFTNVGPDVQDLFIEKINPANANQYEVNGQWVDMTVAEDVIKVKGGGSEPVTIRGTRHGPLITDVYGLESFATQAGLDAATTYGLALRWTALEPGHLFRAIFKMNRAQNWEEFRAAIPDFDAPAQNIVYADVDGNIGYQTPGHIPIRKGGDGLMPVPGWTDDYEWTGYIPFEEMPYAYNPPQGYIATANNAVVGPDYPHPISLEWDAGYRAERIVAMIEATPKLSIADIQKIQGDDLNLGSQEVLPSLLALSFDDSKLSAAAGQLRGWDGQMTIDSAPAAIYMSFFNRLLSDTFDDDLPEDSWLHGEDRSWVVVRGLLAQPDSAWWDNTKTAGVEKRDDILRQAFAEGYADLEKRLGNNPSAWAWGKLHTATFENLTLGRSGIGPIEMLFNRGPFPAAGGPSIVNATGFNLARDDSDVTADPFAVTSVPSMRMIVDLSNLDNSLAIHTTGESGHAYAPHYIDMADRWRLIQYHPMLWSRASVEGNAEARLSLRP